MDVGDAINAAERISGLNQEALLVLLVFAMAALFAWYWRTAERRAREDLAHERAEYAAGRTYMQGMIDRMIVENAKHAAAWVQTAAVLDALDERVARIEENALRAARPR